MADSTEHGAPADFGGRVFPQTNPPTIPHLDTDPPETAKPVGATFNIDNAPLGHPEMSETPKPARAKPPAKLVKPLVKGHPSAAFDPIGDIMRHHKIPMTRENYVALNHLGDNAESTPEEDAEMPARFQPAYPTHEELKAKTEPKKK